MLPRNMIAMLAALMLIVAACGENDASDGGADPTATIAPAPTRTPAPTSEPEPTSTDEPDPGSSVDGGYELVAAWGERAILATPNDVAFAGDGTMFVSDHGLRRILVFDAAGEQLTSWQPVGVGPDGSERPMHPTNIAANSQGILYVADNVFGGAIVAFDGEGNRLATLTPDKSEVSRHRWMGIEVDDDNRLLALSGSKRDIGGTSEVQFGVYVFTDFELEASWHHAEGPVPHAFRIGPDNSLYVVSHEQRASQVAPGPDTVSILDTRNYDEADWVESSFVVESLPEIDGAFIDWNGQFYAVNQAGPATPGWKITLVSAISEHGDVLEEWEIPEHGKVEPAFAPGIMTGPDELVYFADPRNNRILLLDQTWSTVDEIGVESSSALAGVAGMAIGPQGHLYVVDPLLRRVQIFAEDGSVSSTLPLSGYLAHTLSHPMTLDVDSDGNVYVSQDYPPLDSMVKLSPEGDVLQEWRRRTLFDLDQGLTAIFAPSSVAVDDEHGFYITVNQMPWVLLFREGSDEPDAYWPDSDSRYGDSLDVVFHDGRVLVSIITTGEAGETVVEIRELDPDLETSGTTIAQFPMRTLENDADTGFVRKFTVDREGNIYAADPVDHQIIKLGPDGEEITRWSIEPFIVTANVEMFIAVDDTGRVFVTGPDTRQIAVYAPAE